MEDMGDSLVMRRSKRSTAGNRLEAVLAEFRAEDVGVDVEEDVDFIMEKDEEDDFESDFESTDEEAAQEETDAAAEKSVRDDERVSKIGGKSQLDRITAAAHKRHQVAFNPEMYDVEVQKKKLKAAAKLKRKVAMGTVVDVETGEITAVRAEDEAEGEVGEAESRRRSKRAYTVQNRTAHIQRIRNEEEHKKSAAPKKVKTKAPPPTQQELLKRALEMEEGNINEHRNYLATEEEKRKRARMIRTAVEGPLLRWISKAEEVKVIVEQPAAPQPPPPPAPTPIRPAVSAGQPSITTYQYGYSYPNMPGTSTPPSAPAYTTGVSAYYPYAVMHQQQTSSSTTPSIPPSSAQSSFVYSYPQQHSKVSEDAAPPPAPPPQSVEHLETVAKCYVVHELDQDDDASKPAWEATMAAMFGDHVKWEELRVYTGKGRPMSRPVPTCMISGLPARYLDPRTGVPFANVKAFKTLTRILNHEFIWDETLGCYTNEAPIVAPDSPPQHSLNQTASSPGVNTRKRGAKQAAAT